MEWYKINNRIIFQLERKEDNFGEDLMIIGMLHTVLNKLDAIGGLQETVKYLKKQKKHPILVAQEILLM